MLNIYDPHKHEYISININCYGVLYHFIAPNIVYVWPVELILDMQLDLHMTLSMNKHEQRSFQACRHWAFCRVFGVNFAAILSEQLNLCLWRTAIFFRRRRCFFFNYSNNNNINMDNDKQRRFSIEILCLILCPMPSTTVFAIQLTISKWIARIKKYGKSIAFLGSK